MSFNVTRNAMFLAVAVNIPIVQAGLNDTGITTCSNATQNGLPCSISSPAVPTNKEKVTTALANIAVPFEENRGQGDAQVAFQAKTLAGPLFVTKTGELVWSLTPASPHKPQRDTSMSKQSASAEFVGPPAPTYSVVERFIGGAPKPAGKTVAATQVNYFHGNDRSKWHSGVATWQQVSLGQVWPGIEVSIAARGNNAEKLFTVAPGADVSKIAVEVAGGELAVTKDGALQVNAAVPLLTFTPPIAYQDIAGQRKPVAVQYRLAAFNRYGFNLGAHDATQPVVIDPLIQATYLGGSADDSCGIVVTVDAVYAAGTTKSVGFPGTDGGVVPYHPGSSDAFVAKLSLDLRTLIQATYLGGDSWDYTMALSLTTDSVYVAGATGGGFPNTTGGAQATSAHGDAFVAKLSLDLRTLTQATYLGGLTDSDGATSMVVTHDAVYVAGNANSGDFPHVTGGAQPRCIFGAFNLCLNAFIAKLSPDLRTLIQATYVGGYDDDVRGGPLAVTNKAVYLGGNYRNWRQLWYFNMFLDGFSLDLRTQISHITLSGNITSIIPTSNAVYIAGTTGSANFPGTTGGAQATLAGGWDGFVAKLSPDLNTITQATYIGGNSGEEGPYALAITNDGVFVTGYTQSATFSGTKGGAQENNAGGQDAFITKFSPDLRTLNQSTYLGGGGNDVAVGMATTTNTIYVAGYTNSTDFPNTNGGAQGTHAGFTSNYDAFIAKFDLSLKLGVALTITKSGTGNGTVTSNPAGINCGNVCATGFSNGTKVTLTATPASGSTFEGWTGDADCTDGSITMDDNKACTAKFTLTQPTAPTTALESPQQGSYESGIGLIRGWSCNAKKIEVEIDGKAKIPVAYGTPRDDTASTCGDSNNGFGLTYNWNLLSNGTHTIKAFADDIVFSTTNFTTTSLGTEYLTGVGGDATVANFPAAGRTTTIRWAEPHQNFVIVPTSKTQHRHDSDNEIAPPTKAGTTGALESPQKGSFESGIGLIRGWVCQATKIEVEIDGKTKIPVAYGTPRDDTKNTCGDSNNGFGLTYNWNLLGNGNHTIKVFADNVEFGNVTFTVTTLGVEYLQGASGTATITNFPGMQKNTKVRWAEPHQNFVIVP